MGTASSLGVKWWQIMTRRQGHRETVRLRKYELKRCCSLRLWVHQVYALCKKKSEAQFVQVLTVRLPLRITVCYWNEIAMWKLSQQHWQTLCLSSTDSLKNTEFAHQTDAAVEHENYPCSFLKSSEHVRHLSQNIILAQKFSEIHHVSSVTTDTEGTKLSHDSYTFLTFFGSAGLQPCRDNPKHCCANLPSVK